MALKRDQHSSPIPVSLIFKWQTVVRLVNEITWRGVRKKLQPTYYKYLAAVCISLKIKISVIFPLNAWIL